jgi:AcrR family transcriptional regulator
VSKRTQAIVLERRKPRQARAQLTRESIFEAAARIIEREGLNALNTNHIAERAGISIGTLYEYFPNKQAVLIAMARRRLAEDAAVVRQALLHAMDDPQASLIRLAVRTLVRLQQQRPKVRRAIMAVHLASGFSNEHAKPVQDVTQLLAENTSRIVGNGLAPLSQASLFVVSRAVMGVIRAAFEERSQLPGTEELENELVCLVEGYLGARQRPSA